VGTVAGRCGNKKVLGRKLHAEKIVEARKVGKHDRHAKEVLAARFREVIEVKAEEREKKDAASGCVPKKKKEPRAGKGYQRSNVS